MAKRKKKYIYIPRCKKQKYKPINRTKEFFKCIFRGLTDLQKRDIIIKLNMPITLTEIQQKVIELRLASTSYYKLRNEYGITFDVINEKEALKLLRFRYFYLFKQNMIDSSIFKKNVKVDD